MHCHRVTARIDHELQCSVRGSCGASILIIPRVPRVTGKNVSCETKKFTEPVREVKIPTCNPNGLRAIFCFISWYLQFRFRWCCFVFISLLMDLKVSFVTFFFTSLLSRPAQVPFDNALIWEEKISSYPSYHSQGITPTNLLLLCCSPSSPKLLVLVPGSLCHHCSASQQALSWKESIERIPCEQALPFPPHPYSNTYQ